MNQAIIALTKQGTELARKLHTLFPDSDVYVPLRFFGENAKEYSYDVPLRTLVSNVFPSYQSLLLIMATGTAIRVLAPLLRGKRIDPGVLVIDERGTFVISLLGGHAQGANALAREVASYLGAQPVITTASDVRGYIAIDLLGNEWGWERESWDTMTRVSAAIVNGDRVFVYQEAGETNWDMSQFPSNVYFARNLEELTEAEAALIITDRTLDDQPDLIQKSVVYRPKSLVLGMGFNKGTSAGEIEEAVREMMQTKGFSLKSLGKVATLDLKAKEAGLLQFALTHNLEVESLTAEELRSVAFPSPPSETVSKAVGTPAVCEPAALLSSGSTELLVTKVKQGNVTLALARRDLAIRGKLYIVGTGPGSPRHLTLGARQALRESEVVLGYKTYLNLVEDLLVGKEVHSSGMRHELDRAQQAIDLATSGRRVALVSGGDSGIYGMAAPVFELLDSNPFPPFDLEVLPGVPALCAASSLLGAPLSQDIACISLSDLLIPQETIFQRLEAAAAADFVMVLYNPKSKGRSEILRRARERLLRHRSPQTPVGIVRQAYRECQEVLVTDLESLPEEKIDMSTLLIIGNSTSRKSGDWLFTPRGYKSKYG